MKPDARIVGHSLVGCCLGALLISVLSWTLEAAPCISDGDREKTDQPVVVRIEPDHTNCVYKVGDEVTLTVGIYGTNGVDKAEYGVFDVSMDDFTEIPRVAGQIDVAKENPVVFRRKLVEPGFTRLIVKSSRPIKNHTSFSKDFVWGIACEPERIVQKIPCPADFDVFWSAAKAKLAQEVPLDPRIEKDEARSAESAAFDWYHVSFATFGQSRVYGWLSLPKDITGRKVPCRVQVPGAGFGNYSQEGDSRKGCATLFMTVFDFAPSRDLKVGKPLYEAMCKRLKEATGVLHYPEAGLKMRPEDCFYYSRLLGISRAVDWLAVQPYADKSSFTYHGTSQGGGFGLALMALNDNFTRGCVFVPAITGHFMDGGRQQGWPQYRAETKLKGMTDAERANVDRNAALFDGVNFASRITKPIRFVVGFSDTVCAPHAVYAAYNACPSKDKAILHGIGQGHDPYPEFYRQLTQWEDEMRQEQPLKVLMIGNSFSISVLKHLPGVARAMGKPVDVCSLYIGGCSLERHAGNIAIAATNALYRPYGLSWEYTSDPDPLPMKFGKRRNASIQEALRADAWNVVTIQQASHESYKESSFHPWADKVIATVRELAPKARIVIQQTWSYSKLDSRVYDRKTHGPGSNGRMDQNGMYERLTTNYVALARQYGLDIIPMGRAVQLFRERRPVTFVPERYNGVTFERPALPETDDVVGRYMWHQDKKTSEWRMGWDSIHLNALGTYLQGCVWAAKLLNVDVTDCPYAPETLGTPETLSLARRCAMEAVRSDLSEGK